MPDEPSPALWRGADPPRSRRTGDLYYSAEDGLAESRLVFLAGCGLPEAWRGRRRFCVAELGFGTGLNIAALLELWTRTRPVDAWLSIFSVEAWPLPAVDAARALAAWPELAETAGALISGWPGRARGFHRLELPGFRATLDVAVMEAAEALEGWRGQADAWFLDGFSPALDPELWRDAVLKLVAERSATGARLGAFTAAGAVRRGLASAGFDVERAPGYGRKRHRTEARWPGAPAAGQGAPSVAIVGGGIAAASLARAFRLQRQAARVFDAGRPAASRGPAALVAPRLDAGLGPQAALFAQAFARARRLYDAEAGAVLSTGALQLAIGSKDAARFAAIAASDLFEPGAMRILDAGEVEARLGEAAGPALSMETAAVVDPSAILDRWLGVPEMAEVDRIEREAGRWRLLDADGAELASADIVCLAAASATAKLWPDTPIRSVRGQATLALGAAVGATALFGGYVAQIPGAVMIGATHDRDDPEPAARADDDERNLAGLAARLPRLAAELAKAPRRSWVGVRATTSDFLPLAGAASQSAPGLFLLTGMGSRGFTLAPLLAEHVAAEALGAPSPLPSQLAALVDPGRFAARAARRGRGPRAAIGRVASDEPQL